MALVGVVLCYLGSWRLKEWQMSVSFDFSGIEYIYLYISLIMKYRLHNNKIMGLLQNEKLKFTKTTGKTQTQEEKKAARRTKITGDIILTQMSASKMNDVSTSIESVNIEVIYIYIYIYLFCLLL